MAKKRLNVALNEKIASNIKRFRMEAKLTQIDLAIKCGLTQQSTINRIESGVNGATVASLYKIAKALDRSTSELFGETHDSLTPRAKEFYYKFSEIIDLSKDAQSILLKFIKRLGEKK